MLPKTRRLRIWKFLYLKNCNFLNIKNSFFSVVPGRFSGSEGVLWGIGGWKKFWGSKKVWVGPREFRGSQVVPEDSSVPKYPGGSQRVSRLVHIFPPCRKSLNYVLKHCLIWKQLKWCWQTEKKIRRTNFNFFVMITRKSHFFFFFAHIQFLHFKKCMQ